MLADVNGVRMAYSDADADADSGAGRPPVLLVHGFPFSRAMWDPQAGALRARGRVIAVDLRGFGASEAGPAGPLTMERHADDLASLLDHLGVAEPVVYVGLSMGGYVAFPFWRRHRQRVRALVLADTRAGADTETARAGRLTLAERVEAEASAQPVIEAMLPRLFAPSVSQEAPVARRLKGIMAGTSPRAAADGLRGLAARPDSTPLLPGMDVPALVLVGEHDQITPPAESEMMAAALPDARLEVVAGAGHMSNLENPDAFNQALLAFLARL